MFFYEGQQGGIFNEKTIFNYKNSIMFSIRNWNWIIMWGK